MEERTLRQPSLPKEPYEFVAEIRRCLIDGINSDVIVTAPKTVLELLKHESNVGADGNATVTVFGGATFDKGVDTGEFFVRRDGARISFTVTAAYPDAAQPAWHSYRFHLSFAEGGNPRYLRIDLNRPGGGNALLEPRSHVHVGAENLRVPVPIMSPTEILEKLIYGVPLIDQ